MILNCISGSSMNAIILSPVPVSLADCRRKITTDANSLFLLIIARDSLQQRNCRPLRKLHCGCGRTTVGFLWVMAEHREIFSTLDGRSLRSGSWSTKLWNVLCDCGWGGKCIHGVSLAAPSNASPLVHLRGCVLALSKIVRHKEPLPPLQHFLWKVMNVTRDLCAQTYTAKKVWLLNFSQPQGEFLGRSDCSSSSSLV